MTAGASPTPKGAYPGVRVNQKVHAVVRLFIRLSSNCLLYNNIAMKVLNQKTKIAAYIYIYYIPPLTIVLAWLLMKKKAKPYSV